MDASSPLSYSLEGTTAVLRMDDGKANALSVAMIDALLEGLARAEKEAEKIGVVLLPKVDGHRVGDFPHQVFFRGGIAELDFKPGAGVWILEIQLRHPTLPFGAFFEDSLV